MQCLCGQRIGRIDPMGLVDFVFSIRGEIFRGVTPATNSFSADAYSGAPPYVSGPNATHIKNEGSIPVGTWTMQKGMYRASHGEFVFHLDEHPGTNTFGRDKFMIHGSKHFQQCVQDTGKCGASGSKGCIIMGYEDRRQLSRLVWEGHDILEVVR